MQSLFIRLFKGVLFVKQIITQRMTWFLCKIYFYLNGIEVSSFKSYGIPYIHKSLRAKCVIGKHFVINNGIRYSELGNNGKCRIEIRDRAVLSIGDYVGMSDVTISCHEKIEIGNNVLIGVGTQIRDTNNHSLNPNDWHTASDWLHKKTAPVKIGNNVFIGSNAIILKGVSIGDNAIIGAGSVITRNIPPREVWSGNPAIFFRKNYGG